MLPYQTQWQYYYLSGIFWIGKAYVKKNVEDGLPIMSATYNFNSYFIFTTFK